MNGPRTRTARPEDAEATITVVRRSITQLCVADHKGDVETLALWLANKTPEHFRGWLGRDERHLVVAECDDVICGAGLLSREGKLQLCYVDPAFLKRGVGRALVEALESKGREWGLAEVLLDASLTAMPFYASLGYAPCGPPAPGFGVTIENPLSKRL